jgi:DNA-binding winged helix-turn-helix (wHTH) protein/tetratricopeptide (TPR) repeat protein
MKTGWPTDMTPSRTPLRWRFGACCFDETSLVLTVAGAPVDLERRPLELLALLLAHAGEVVTKAEILAALWADRDVSDASLTKCMARLRRALADGDMTLIHTVHGYGYRLAAKVSAEEVAPPGVCLPASMAFTPGDAVPRRPAWHFVARLGTGGHGDVWLCEHARTRQRLVLKFARDGAGLAGLRREITLGRLLREGLGPREDLVRILDWDLEEAPYFLESAWREQGNLADWAARQGGMGSLPMDVRLDLVAQIADALAAAHAMGVLHKDLKPANVLMRQDAAGRPGIVLTDFGSGRALDPSRLDAFGITRMEADLSSADSTAGTMMYRAPEFAAGGMPTVQADIFALGVILFQMAAGDMRQALAPGWEMRVADPLLREDIGLAAAGDPQHRMADAAALARRLRSLPARRVAVQQAGAQAEEAAHTRRALDNARARRLPLLALLGVLLAGFSTSTLLYVRAEHARGRARQATILAENAASRAEAVTSFVTDDLFSAANPMLGADPTIPVRTVLDEAASGLDRRFPPGSADRAAIEAAIGGAYAGLADPDHALPRLRDALAILRARLGDGDRQVQAVRLTMIDLAERTADMDGLRRTGQDVLAVGSGDEATVLRARFAVAEADCLTHENDALCVQKLQPFLRQVQARLGPRHALTLKVQDLLAYQLSQGQHFDTALTLARATVATTQAVFGAGSVQAQERRYHLGQIQVEAGQADDAIATLQDVRRLLLAIFGHETDMSARAATQLGRAYELGHRDDDGLRMLQTALAYNLRVHGETYQATRFCMNGVAKILAAMGRASEAIPYGARALALQQTAEGADNEDTLWIAGNLANEYRQAGQTAQAERLYAETFTRAHQAFAHGEWDLGHFGFDYGQLLLQEGKMAEARPVLREAVAVLTASLGPGNPRTVAAAAGLRQASAAPKPAPP